MYIGNRSDYFANIFEHDLVGGGDREPEEDEEEGEVGNISSNFGWADT